MRRILSVLLILSFLFSQEPVLLDETGDIQETCEGTCFSDEEVQGLYTSIQEVEYSDSTNHKIIENLNSQIYIYIQTIENDSLMIEDYKKQIELQNEMIKEVKPKWHENKYLWYVGGVLSMIVPIWAVGQVK